MALLGSAALLSAASREALQDLLSLSSVLECRPMTIRLLGMFVRTSLLASARRLALMVDVLNSEVAKGFP